MSLVPAGKGKYWLHIRKEIRKKIGKQEGDPVFVFVEKDDIPHFLQFQITYNGLSTKNLRCEWHFKNFHFSIRSFGLTELRRPGTKKQKWSASTIFLIFYEKVENRALELDYGKLNYKLRLIICIFNPCQENQKYIKSRLYT